MIDSELIARRGMMALAGLQHRTVSCVRSDGVLLDDGECGSVKPATAEPCNLGPCYCSRESDCYTVGDSGNFGCGPAGVCVCRTGWVGDACDSPVSAAAAACASGVTDVNGTCCGTVVDATTGEALAVWDV